MKDSIRAVALISGGLDSLLAAKVVQDQGVHVEGLNFYTGFCVEGHTHSIRSSLADARARAGKAPIRNNALWVAEQLGIKLHIIDVIDDYKDVVLNPKHGYGKNLNPCVDCKVFMVNRAQTWGFMQDNGFDFVITGEVLGQRPKSQVRDKLELIATESGAEDRLLRPLSAKHLVPTLPEREGWIDRDKLFDFHGRNRKPQIALAKSLGFEDWAQPAGGCCFLTDPEYAKRLGDMWNSRNTREYSLDDIMLLKVGRHLRPSPNYKLLIGREEGENNYLEGYKNQFTHIRINSHKGPLTLLDGKADDTELTLAARIAARYSQGRTADKVEVTVHQTDGVNKVLLVEPLPAYEIQKSWHV